MNEHPETTIGHLCPDCSYINPEADCTCPNCGAWSDEPEEIIAVICEDCDELHTTDYTHETATAAAPPSNFIQWIEAPDGDPDHRLPGPLPDGLILAAVARIMDFSVAETSEMIFKLPRWTIKAANPAFWWELIITERMSRPHFVLRCTFCHAEHECELEGDAVAIITTGAHHHGVSPR